MKDMNVKTNKKSKTITLVTTLLLVCGTAGRFSAAQSTNPAVPPTRNSPAPNPAPNSVVGSFTHTTASDQALHVIVGRSMFVSTAARLRKVYVANSAVLDSYTASPNQIIVTAKTPGISTIILWDENGQSKSYLVSSDVNVEGLQTELKQTMPSEQVQAEGSEGRVVLTGTVSSPAIMAAAVKQAELYSKDVANSLVVNEALIKQVRLKVSIVEVDRSKIAQFGFNFFSQPGSLVSSTTTSQFPSAAAVTPGTGTTGAASYATVAVSNPLNFMLYSAKLNVGMTLQDLENRQVLQILAEPTITTLSGEKANFLAGGEFPFPVVQGGAGGLNSVSVQFRPYGVKLEFTPYVNADGTIELKVAPEVSALDYANAAVISGYTIPALSTRRADTQVVLRSGQSFAITGLLDRRTTDLYGKTPGFSSIPILGELFKSKNVNHSVNELVVIVTPTVVDPLTENIVPDVPSVAIPGLEEKKFDKGLPSSAKKP